MAEPAPAYVQAASSLKPRRPGPVPAPEPDLLTPGADREDYDNAIRSCAHRADVAGAEDLVRQMLVEGHKPTLTTCNFLVNACSQAGNLERAQHYLEQMITMGIMPDQVTFNSMINGCAVLGDVTAVENWLKYMIKCGVRPNAVTYGTVCKAFARLGDVDKVERVIKAVEASGETPNAYFYASLISACAESNQPQRAERALVDLAMKGLRPSCVRSAMGRAVGRRRANLLISRLEPPEDPQEKAEAAAARGNGLAAAADACPTPARAPPRQGHEEQGAEWSSKARTARNRKAKDWKTRESRERQDGKGHVEREADFHAARANGDNPWDGQAGAEAASSSDLAGAWQQGVPHRHGQRGGWASTGTDPLPPATTFLQSRLLAHNGQDFGGVKKGLATAGPEIILQPAYANEKAFAQTGPAFDLAYAREKAFARTGPQLDLAYTSEKAFAQTGPELDLGPFYPL